MKRPQIKRYAILLAIISTTAFAITMGDRLSDNVRVGKGAATEKRIQFDVGNGDANPAIRSTAAGNLQFANDGVNFLPFGSGGSSSGINIVQNNGFEQAGNNWTASPTNTFVLTTTAANVGNGTTSGVFTATASGQTLTSALVAIPNAIQNKQCVASMFYKGGDANLTWQVIDQSNAVIASKVLTTLANWGQDYIPFACPSTGSLSFRITSTAASAALYLDEVFLGTKDVVTGPAVGDWQAYTPTSAWTTNTTLTGRWRRIGDAMEVYAHIALTGAPATGDLIVYLPAGYTIDMSKVATTTGLQGHWGTGRINHSSANTPISAIFYTGISNGVALAHDMANTGNSGVVNPIQPFVFASGDYIDVWFSVPVVGWSSNVYLGAGSLQFGSHDGTNVIGGANGAAMLTTTPAGTNDTFDITSAFTNIQPSDLFAIEVQPAGSGSWGPPGWLFDQLRFDGTNYIGANVYVVGNAVKIVRGKYATGTTTTWATALSAGTRWRVRKANGAGVSGFSMFTPGAFAGLVDSRGIAGFTDGSNAATGFIGEAVRSYVSSPVSLTSATYTDVTSITLTPGDWDLSFDAIIGGNPTGVTAALVFIGTAPGNVSTGYNSGDNDVANASFVSGQATSYTMAGYRQSIVASTTYYLKARISYSGGAPSVSGRISARRVR